MASHTKKKSSTPPQWQLNDLYPSMDSKALKEDIRNVSERARRFEQLFKGTLTNMDGDTLASAIAEYEAIEEVLGRLSGYAYLTYAAHISDKNCSAFYQNISEEVNDISLNLLFFTLEINRLKEDTLEKHLKNSAALRHYAPWLRDSRAFREHQLSDDLEKLLHEKNITSSQSWHRLFDETLAGLRFKIGTKMLTTAEAFDLLSSKDGAKREQAAKAIGKTLSEHISTFSLITNVLAKDKDINDRWRKFKQPISSRNLANFIEDDVVETLLSTVTQNYPKLAHRYYALKAKWLGKDVLPYWDRNAPLPDSNEKRIPWEQAVEMVMGAYTRFSPKMAAIGQQFFDKHWVDAEPRAGKESGAFSHPTVPSAHPYILMNYQGKTRDVMTLAHELGHGIHQVLSAKQGCLMADTPLTLAETASVFGEQLTFRALLENESNEKRRKAMIAAKVEDMLNTVVRQVAFCQFERRVHDKRKHGELSAADLGNIWMEVQKESLGPSLKFEEEYQHFWSYIPHFIHSPFYVYAYAFGDCLVNALYGVYQKQPDGFEGKYLTLLEAGGTLRHRELLKPFGLDTGDPAFWQLGLDVIAGFIDELE